jgi:hypothetical protein
MNRKISSLCLGGFLLAAEGCSKKAAVSSYMDMGVSGLVGSTQAVQLKAGTDGFPPIHRGAPQTRNSFDRSQSVQII